MPRLCSFLGSLLIASSVSAVTIDWVPVGNPGNPGETYQGCNGCLGPVTFGAVGYEYQIARYEVTNAQYAEFLNAKAASDPFELYDPRMSNIGVPWLTYHGGIDRFGTAGFYSYAPIAGRESMPVNFVSSYDAMRFANWLQNGQGNGGTETGAYTLLGGTAYPSNAGIVPRNPGATIVLTSENEWYKAAYYDGTSGVYYDYPIGSNSPPTCMDPTSLPNSANCSRHGDGPVPVGSYPSSTSPYGVFDLSGNVAEWTEGTGLGGTSRNHRGGSFYGNQFSSRSDFRDLLIDGNQEWDVGFRLAYIPESSTGMLVIAGLLGLAGWRRTRA